MTTYFSGIFSIGLFAAVMLFSGCERHSELNEIIALRKSGQITEARAKAMEVLRANPERAELWPEYITVTVAAAKIIEREGEDALPLIAEAATAAAAMTRYKKQNVPDEWKPAIRLVMGELGRLGNADLAAYNRETRAADYLTAMDLSANNGGSLSQAQMDAYQAVNDAQRGARARLRRNIILEALLAEIQGSTAIALIEQLALPRTEWIHALKLNADFTAPIIASANDDVKRAVTTATEDLNEVGYLLPSTIFDNGVFK